MLGKYKWLVIAGGCLSVACTSAPKKSKLKLSAMTPPRLEVSGSKLSAYCPAVGPKNSATVDAVLELGPANGDARDVKGDVTITISGQSGPIISKVFAGQYQVKTKTLAMSLDVASVEYIFLDFGRLAKSYVLVNTKNKRSKLIANCYRQPASSGKKKTADASPTRPESPAPVNVRSEASKN